MIESRDLGFRYPLQPPGDPPVLEGITFTLGRGECLGLAGGPGAGKSTLGRLVAGLLLPGRGWLAVEGHRLHARGGDRRQVMERVAWVAQQPERQLFARTVAEDVAAGLVPRGVPPEARRERAARWLDRLGLPPGEFLERPVHALSGGEARKVALAGTLVLERPVLVLDEPSAGLDDPSRCLLWELLAGLKREGTSLVVISHHLMELAHLADRLLVVDGGRTAYLGTWEDLPGELPGGSCLERPPLHQLMRRLGRARPGLPAAVAGPEAAAAVIRPLLAGNQSSPKTSAS